MRALLVFTILGAAACRPDPGLPDYASDDDDSGDDGGFLEGPDPFEEGDERLSFGLFYEGGWSELIEVDDVSRHYYIYDGTYTQAASADFVAEGFLSDRITPTGVGWWGGGLQWDSTEDLSAWTTLHLSFLSADAGFSDFEIKVNAGVEVGVMAGDYGWLNDGEWHHLSVPLDDFAGASFATTTSPLILVGAGTITDQSLYIDNVYLTQE